jgi:predicted RNA-binding Zn-ribbon protein involved in translation (DUF1610 family)
MSVNPKQTPGYIGVVPSQDAVKHDDRQGIGSVQRMVSCVWIMNYYDGVYYETACGKAIELNHGTLKDNHYNYCPCCGGEIIYKPEEAANCDSATSR